MIVLRRCGVKGPREPGRLERGPVDPGIDAALEQFPARKDLPSDLARQAIRNYSVTVATYSASL